MLLVGCALTLPAAAACSRSPDLDAARLFQEAGERLGRARSEQDYLEAAGRYEQLVARGLESGAVYYDLGNALYLAGRRGQAIAAWRRAQRYWPRDPWLAANLQNALPPDPTGARDQRRFLDLVLFWQDDLGYHEKALAVAAAAGATFLAFAGWQLRRRAGWRRAGGAGLAVTAVLGASLLLDWHRYERRRPAVLTAPDVVARKGDGPAFEPAFTQSLPEGTEGEVVMERGEWLLLRFGRDLEGWVRSDQVVVRGAP